MKQSTFELQDLYFANRKQNWLTLFTTSYILLHNLELIIKRERDIAHASHSEVCIWQINKAEIEMLTWRLQVLLHEHGNHNGLSPECCYSLGVFPS